MSSLPETYDPIRVLREHEGYRDHVYCDLCGKPWMECAGKREEWLTGWPPSVIIRDQYGTAKKVMSEKGICPGGTPTWGIGQTYTTKANAEVFVRERLTEIDAELRVQGFTPENIGAARFEGMKHMCYQLGSLRDWPRFVEYMLPLSGSRALESNYAKDFAEFAADELLWKDGRTEQDRSDWWTQEEPAPNRCEQIAEIIRSNELPAGWYS